VGGSPQRGGPLLGEAPVPVVNALVTGAGIAADPAFRTTGTDLFAVAAAAYAVGVDATVAIKSIMGP
jgi:hypothetical protein